MLLLTIRGIVSGSIDLILRQNICQSVDIILLWFKSNRLTANSEKTKFIIYSRTLTSCTGLPSVEASNDVRIKCVSFVRYLGIIIDENLSFKPLAIFI